MTSSLTGIWSVNQKGWEIDLLIVKYRFDKGIICVTMNINEKLKSEAIPEYSCRVAVIVFNPELM